MSTRLQDQFGTARCRTVLLGVDKHRRIHRCYTPGAVPAYSVIRLSAREMQRFASPTSLRKINADAPVLHPVVLSYKLAIGESDSSANESDTRRPVLRQYRNGLYRFPILSPASLRRDDKNGILLRYPLLNVRNSFEEENNCASRVSSFFRYILQQPSLYYRFPMRCKFGEKGGTRYASM